LPAHQADLQAIYYNTPAEKAQGLLFGFSGTESTKKKNFCAFKLFTFCKKNGKL
jgi:hypothetical protein